MTRRTAGRGPAISQSKVYRWFLPAILLVAAPNARAAGKCEGQWHFELSRPTAEGEEWLPKGSWCRSDKLPKTIDVNVRYRVGGGVEISGHPYDVKDLGHAGSRCEFIFEGKTSGMPEENELKIEVTDKVAAIRGTGTCSHADPRKPDGTRTGVSTEISVSGSYSAVPAAQASNQDAIVATVVRACREQAGDTVWNLMTSRFHAELEQRATELRQALPATELRKMYDYRGRREDFSGQVFWGLMVKSRRSLDNPCSGADKWKVGENGNMNGGSITVIYRTSGTAFGLKLAKENGSWRLDQITKSVTDQPN